MFSMRYVFCLVLMLVPLTLAAEEKGPDAPAEPSDSGFGGPSGVQAEQNAIEDILNAFRADERKLHLKRWHDWKAKLNDRTGFSFGINAQVVYAGVSDTLAEEDNAAGGIYRLQGEWALFGRETGHPGSIIFRIENRSKIGSGIPPASLRGEIGATATNPVFAYSDNFGTDFSVLAWQQLFTNKRAGVAAGILDFSAYLDAMYYQTIARGFLNRSFILNPTVATTGIGALGVAAKGMIGEHFWVGGGFYDANAKSGDPSFDTWDSNELLKHVELGWTPGFSRRATDRVQLSYWQKDRLVEKETPSGSGWLVSYSWEVADRWVPFARAGWSNGGGGALAKRSVAVGFSYQIAFQDWLTMGIGWNKPSDKTHEGTLNSEKVLEASYLWQITATTSLLPDLQVIFDPANNPDEDTVWFAGIRLRLTF
jgi:porin